MNNKYINELKQIFLQYLADEKVKLFLFGSRARKSNYFFSDVDIGLIPYGKINEKKLTLIKEKIEDSNIPYKVEIINFNNVSEKFKKEALKEIEIWKD